MEFGELPEEEYELFISSHELGNFLQSSAIGKRREASGWATHRVGVRDGKGEIIAAALLTSRSILYHLYLFESLQGPVLDYDDEPVVRFFFSQLRMYLREHNALRLRINPPLLLRHRDCESNIIDDGYSGDKYVDLLKKQGLFHLDNRTVDKDPLLLRWYSAKDMTPYTTADELMESFDPQARWSIRKTQKLGIEVKRLPIDQIDEFYAVIEHTSQRRKFGIRNKQYYLDLARHFGPNGIQFCVAQLDLNKYETTMRAYLEDAVIRANKIKRELDLNKAEDKRLSKQLKVADEETTHCHLKLSDITQLRQGGDTLTMAGAVFIHYGNELVYYSAGSYERYMSFGAPYALQYYAQLYAIEHGIPRYNFYGTKGRFSGNPEQHGVYRFKKGLGGNIEEQIGYFEMYNSFLLSNLTIFSPWLRILSNSSSQLLHMSHISAWSRKMSRHDRVRKLPE